MKKFFKKYWLFVAIISLGVGVWAASSNDITDLFTIKGTGSLNNTAVAYIDSSRSFNLYDGNIVLGQSGSRPSTSFAPNFQVPIQNGNTGSAITAGDIVIAQSTATTSGLGVTASILSTTTIVGVAVENIAAGAVGKMAVGGYALVHTTGPVFIGDLIVTTNTAVGYGGRIGAAAGTSDLVGVIVGRAMSVGTVTGGSTLVKLN